MSEQDEKLIALKAEAESRAPFFHWHWQNLNERDGKKGSGLREGRAWLHFGRLTNRRTICLSWNLWTHFCGLGLDVDDEDATFMAAFPPLACWLSFSSNCWAIKKFWPKTTISKRYGTQPRDPDYVMLDEREIGIKIHDGKVWISPWGRRMEMRMADPWWVRGVTISINPFEWTFQKHEVRSWKGEPGWNGFGNYYWEPAVDQFDAERKKIPQDNRHVYTGKYRYTLKNGTVQDRTATFYVERRSWRPRCLQWTKLFEKVSTVIDVRFSEEVGEKSGSWKGGCIGCGWGLLPGESPYDALRRMEATRKF